MIGAKIPVHVYTKSNSFLSTEHRVLSAYKIHKVVANKPFKVFSAKLFAFEKKLSAEMARSYATKR